MGLFGLLAWLVTGMRFSDVTSGFRALSGDVVRFVATEWYPPTTPTPTSSSRYAAPALPPHRGPGAHVSAGARRRSMHAGLAPVYYVFKMLLSVSAGPAPA